MRISLVLLFVAVLQLYAETGYAQKTNVSISMSNASIEQVLNKIEETSDYVFLYNDKTINTNRIVSVNNPKGNIIQILNHVFDNTNITYTIVDKQIILSTTQLFSTSQSSGFEVKGVVKDILGEPLIGVNVRVKGTNTGAITDLEGQFTLRVRKGDVIEFSYVGYTSKSLKIEGGGNLSIVLQENAKALEEVVVTALGIKRSEKALSYNVQQVNSDELTTVKDANFVNSLVGKVAGVQINSGANGAGGTSRIIMRGVKSIEKGNNVLYVIDGIPMYNHSFSDNGGAFGGQTGSESSADINPEDIESVNMLTGPSAAALYGSDAANGVILINTKKGVKGHTLVTVTNNTVFSTVQMLPKMQTTYGTSSGLMSWGDNVESNYDAAKFFNTGANIINAVSVSTGNQKNQSYFSASTTNVIGVVPENTYDRYNFAARNTTSFANDKLVLDFGANYIMQTDENMVSQGKYNNPLPALYLFPRGDDFNEIRLYERWNPVLGYMTQYWPYGEGAHSLQNPYWIQNRMKRKSDKSRYMLNASLTWNITDWMNIVGRVRVDNSEYRITKDLYASTLTTFCDTNGGYEDQTQHDKSFYGDVMLNINKTFRDNYSIVVNLGTSINDQSFESAGGAGNLILTNHFAMNNLNYQSKYKSIQSGWHDQIQSIFGSAELGYKSMLYMTVTGRNDWASQLAFSDQSSFFYPSVGFSGIITNIFVLPKQINYIKVRASYSKVASAFNRFMSNPSYTFNTQTQQWAKPNTSPLDHMRPEDTKSWEFGLNAKLFDNQITLDATFYKSNTYHQTIYGSTSGASLYANQVVQTGNIQNRGIELALGYNKKWGKFDWSSTFTYSLNQNEVKELAAESKNKDGIPEIQKDYLGASSVAPQVILYEGGSMSDIYVKHELARDLNGHILIDPSTGTLKMTETAPKRVGQLAPRYNLGWNNNFSYGNLNVGIVFTARVGGLTYSATQGVLDYYGVSQNSADARNAGGININYGKVEAEKYYQTISTAEGGYGAYYLYSATNVRLQELSLSYTLPREWFNNKAKLSIGFTGKNLCMIFCKAPFDPEISAATGSAYYQGVDYFMQPSTRNLGFNVKLQF